MANRAGSRNGRARRRACLEFDRLEQIQLLASGLGVHHSLGSFIAPALVRPRVSTPVTIVDPHEAINTYMASILGTPIEPIQQVVENQETSRHSNLVEQVLGNTFVHGVLGDQDTYTLLQSSGMSALLGQSPDQSSQDSTGSSVTYVLPPSSILSIGDPDSTVFVPSSGNLAGFIAVVPTVGIRTLSSGFVSVQIPVASIPTNAPPPTNSSQVSGSLADVFAASGPLIFSALRTGLPLRSPNSPRSVPGLRLARQLSHERFYPRNSSLLFLRMFRVAVDRGVFTLGSSQLLQVQAGLSEFNATVAALNQQGKFTPPVPPAAPPLPHGRLGGTLQVSTGALRDLVNVAASQTGLQLPEIGNVPGRIDVGYIFARNGDYGLSLTFRGPLNPSPPLPPVDDVASTIQVEVSNAPSLATLNGLRTVEGLSIGTALMGTVATSRTASGFATFSTSAGYGAGIEYGTGIAYTLVIPLGNLNALIPQAPPVR